MTAAVVFVLVLWLASGKVETYAVPLDSEDACGAYAAIVAEKFDTPDVMAKSSVCLVATADIQRRG